MAWKGLALKSELAMIIGCRTLSSFLARGINTVLGFGGGDVQRVFPLDLGQRCSFSLPDQPGIWCLRRRFGGVVFRGFSNGFLSQSFLVGLHRSDC